MFEDNNPYDLLMSCVRIINQHGEMFGLLGKEMEKSDEILLELSDQMSQLTQQIRVMNQQLKLINSRIAALEGRNATE